MSGLPGSTTACSRSKLVPRLMLQNFARFFKELTSLYQSPPPLYFNNASFTVGGSSVHEMNTVEIDVMTNNRMIFGNRQKDNISLSDLNLLANFILDFLKL